MSVHDELFTIISCKAKSEVKINSQFKHIFHGPIRSSNELDNQKRNLIGVQIQLLLYMKSLKKKNQRKSSRKKNGNIHRRLF